MLIVMMAFFFGALSETQARQAYPSLTVGVFQPSEFLNKISTDHSSFLTHRSKLNYLS